MVESIILIVAGSTISGIISAILFTKTLEAKKKQGSSRLVKPFDKIRSDLESLKFEKDLVIESIARVYQAAACGKIDDLEKDRLLAKYKQQMESYNQRISKIKPISDIVELHQTRNEIILAIEDKIKAIDQKIMDITNKSDIGQSEILKSIRIQTANLDKKEIDQIAAFKESTKTISKETSNSNSNSKSEEKSIEKLQQEIMQALTRLEQIEVQKD